LKGRSSDRMVNKEIKKLKEDIETLENMFSALVDILEKKKIISDKELDNRIKKKLEQEKNLREFENI